MRDVEVCASLHQFDTTRLVFHQLKPGAFLIDPVSRAWRTKDKTTVQWCTSRSSNYRKARLSLVVSR